MLDYETILNEYEQYLILVEGFPTQGQIEAFEMDEWLLKELIADYKGGYAYEYEIIS